MRQRTVDILVGIGLGAIGLAIAWCAHAQMPDYCSAPLAAKDAPPTALDWRLRCTIQKLEAERVQQADRATQDEVEIARLAALLSSATAPKSVIIPPTPFDLDLAQIAPEPLSVTVIEGDRK